MSEERRQGGGTETVLPKCGDADGNSHKKNSLKGKKIIIEDSPHAYTVNCNGP